MEMEVKRESVSSQDMWLETAYSRPDFRQRMALRPACWIYPLGWSRLSAL